MKKLKPILTYPENYNFVSTREAEFDPQSKKSVFVSHGRVPGCIFTQFTGPGPNSKQVTILATGDEALFGLLPDYTYKISWSGSFAYANFWTINSERTLAYQLYTTSGKKARLKYKTGCFKIFGYNFPIVLEIPAGGHVTITVELDEHLIENNYLAKGDFCYEGRYLYSNTGPSSNLIRTVSSELAYYNQKLRNKYLSNYRGPCQNTLLLSAGKQTLTVLSESTCNNYAGSIWGCSGMFWLALDVDSLTPLNNQVTQDIFGSFISCYGYVSVDTRVKVDFDITLTYEDNVVFYDCDEQLNARSIGMYSNNNKEVLTSEEGNPVRAYPKFSGKNVIFQAFDYYTSVTRGDYIYFGGYGLISSGLKPIKATGTIIITY